MNTKQIDYCIELAHTLNFSRAAENLFVSQPSFSYQIRLLEEEVGFAIFERSGKGASLTPAGTQFVGFLSGMREDLKRAIEQGQNFSAKYKDSISISLLMRQAVHFLPEAMRLFAVSHPDVQIVPLFRYENGVEAFLREEADILFTLKEETRQIPGITVHDLYTSHIYLIAQTDDPLAEKNLIHEEDLWLSRCAPGCPAPSDRFRKDRLFQQRGPRHDPDQCCRGERRLPCARVLKRPQRAVRLDPLRLQGELLLRPLHPQERSEGEPCRIYPPAEGSL